MDVHVNGKPRPLYRLNGYQHAKDDGLQFLSMEEKECILFFEETIDSLEEGFDDTKRLSSRTTTSAGALQNLSSFESSPVHAAKASPSVMENDIIDLVRSPTNFTMPDFPNPAVTPEPHYETFPKRVPIEGVSSSITRSNAHEENDHQPPPGSVPTPVAIASKIAEHQGTGRITPSKLLGHRRSLESKRDPPLSARTPRLPSNISITQGNRDTSAHSLATAAVNSQERRSLVYANMPTGSHPLEGGEPSCMRNPHMRTVPFKEETPDKSRMEALSKLGLTGGKTSNLTASSLITKGSSSPSSSNSSYFKGSSSPTSSQRSSYKGGSSPTSSQRSSYKGGSSPASLLSSLNIGSNSSTSSNSNAYKVSSSPTSAISSLNKGSSSAILSRHSANKVSVNTQAHLSNNINTSSNTFGSSNSSFEPNPRSEVVSSSFNRYGGKSAAITPMTKDNTAPVNKDRRSSIPPSSAEVKQTDFNSYGGKTVVLNPTKSCKTEFIPSPTENESAETHFNRYGGRSRVMNPLLNTDVPDGADCGQSQSTTNAVTPTMQHSDPTRLRYPSNQTSYDPKLKVATPLQPDPVYQALVRTRPATLPSPMAPKPICPTGSMRPRPDLVPPEILSKPVPSIRTQGITVQFSGKGTTGDARRDALRRLGLLNNTS